MKISAKELLSSNFEVALPKEFKDFATMEGKMLQFYYLYDDSKSRIVDIKGLKMVSSITTLAFKGRPFSAGGEAYAIGGFGNILDTQNTLLFMFLKYYTESWKQISDTPYNEMLKFFVKAKDSDLESLNTRLVETTYKNSFDITTRTDFEDAMQKYLIANPQITSSVMSIVDAMDGYHRKKTGKPIFFNCIEKVVTALPLGVGGLVPEKNGSFDYFYIGENSEQIKSGDETLVTAKSMLRDGFAVSEIFLKTGWYFNPKDSKWRKFIDDSEAKLKVNLEHKNSVYIKADSKFSGQENNVFNAMGGLLGRKFDFNAILELFNQGWDTVLGDVLDHPTLYKHYPSLYKMPIFFGHNSLKKQYTFFQTPVGFLVIFGNPDEFDLLTVLLHETQHAIQGIEGFSQGGNLQLADMIMTIGGDSVRRFYFLNESMSSIYSSGANSNGIYSYSKYQKFISYFDGKSKSLLGSQGEALFESLKVNESAYYKSIDQTFQNILNIYLNLIYAPLPADRDNARRVISEYLGKEITPALIEVDVLMNNTSNKKSVLKSQGYSVPEIESLFFSAYESLVGETESRDVQHTSKIESEVKGYVMPMSSERIEDKMVTSIFKGMKEEVAPENVLGGVEKTAEGKYIIHLFEGFSPAPVLHELGHIVNYLLEDLKPLELISKNILEEKINEAGGAKEAFCELFLSYLVRKDLNPRMTRALSQDRKLHEYPVLDTVFDVIFDPKEAEIKDEEKLNQMFSWMKHFNNSLDRSTPAVPENPAPAPDSEKIEVNLYNIFSDPSKFMEYDGQFLYPPRAENRFRERMLGQYDNGQYIAQVKMNGSATSITINELGAIPKERHNTFFAVPPTFNFKAMHRGKGNMCVVGEFMNKSKKDGAGNPFKGFVIWDFIAFDGQILIGSTIEQRMKLVDKLYPTTGVIEFDGIGYLETTEIEGIYKAVNFTGDFSNLYNKLTPVDAVEGLVLKRKNGVLEMPSTETSNKGWALKVRKPTANYLYKKGGKAGVENTKSLLSDVEEKKYNTTTKEWGDIHIIPTSNSYWSEIKSSLDKSGIEYTMEKYDNGTEYFILKKN